jgi:hypothetical protein
MPDEVKYRLIEIEKIESPSLKECVEYINLCVRYVYPDRSFLWR